MAAVPNLYLLSPPETVFLSELPDLFEAGVDMFQYRRPNVSDREAFEQISTIQSLSETHGVKFFVNDRPDLALVCEADGVHLGAEDLNPSVVKSHWEFLTVGATQRANNSLVSGVDYRCVGPVFRSDTKELSVEPCGWDGVQRVIAKASKPVYAIGGITPERLLNAPYGLAGIAVTGGVWNTETPYQAVESYKQKVRQLE